MPHQDFRAGSLVANELKERELKNAKRFLQDDNEDNWLLCLMNSWPTIFLMVAFASMDRGTSVGGLLAMEL